MTPEQIFDELKMTPGVINGALEVARVASRNHKGELSKILKENYDWKDVTPELVGQIECSEVNITFSMFKDVCSAIGFTPVEILKSAVLIKDCKGKTGQEVEKELLDELKYLIWRPRPEE